MSAKYADKTLGQLKRSRSAMLGVITKISNEAQPLLKKDKSNLLDEDIDLLHYWKEKLETKVEEIAHLNAAIIEVTPDNDADMEKELEDAENFERKNGTLLKAVSRILEQFEETDATSLTPLQESTNATSNSHNSSHIKIPKFDLPKFNGEYKKWVPFYEQFMASVDNNPSIPAIQKFNYLKASLTDEALQLVAHLPFSNSNYPIALKSLVDRYNNPRLILNSHLDAIFDLKSMKGDSASELRKLFVTFEENLMAIRALELGRQFRRLHLGTNDCRKIGSSFESSLGKRLPWYQTTNPDAVTRVYW